MILIRPEVQAALRRWREVAMAAALGLVGLWFALIGGWILGPAGVLFGAVALVWAVIAQRRLRFMRRVEAPGVVEVDEGQVGYFGPTFGGFVSLRELVEIRFILLHGAGHWWLKQADGQVLLIPVTATGAGALYDAFATLPGVDMRALTDAVGTGNGVAMDTRTLWQRPDHAALT